MITFVTGKPGDGKTLYSVGQILERLCKTERFIVTNIPLNLGAVREYCAKRRVEIDVDERLKVIHSEEVFEFYRHRSGGLVLPWSPDKDGDARDRMPKPEFNAVMEKNVQLIKEAGPVAWKPVDYWIDETHDFFSAREWATNGRATLWYASKHRHLHDEVIFITQVMENVEKQLRGLASETVVVRNHLRRSWGPFKMRPLFRVRSYYGIPTPQMTPYSITDFHLDPAGVAGCYKTVGALGVHSTPEQITNKGKLPWWTLPLGGVALVALVGAFIIGLPALGGKAAARMITGSGDAMRKELGMSGVRSDAGTPGRLLPVGADGYTSRPDARRGDTAPRDRVWMTGYVARGARVQVCLSDGRTLTEADGDLVRVERNFCELRDGTRYYLQRPAPGRPIEKAPAVVAANREPVVAPDSLAEDARQRSEAASRPAFGVTLPAAMARAPAASTDRSATVR